MKKKYTLIITLIILGCDENDDNVKKDGSKKLIIIVKIYKNTPEYIILL